MIDLLLYAATLIGGILIGLAIKSPRLDALERKVTALEVRAGFRKAD